MNTPAQCLTSCPFCVSKLWNISLLDLFYRLQCSHSFFILCYGDLQQRRWLFTRVVFTRIGDHWNMSFNTWLYQEWQANFSNIIKAKQNQLVCGCETEIVFWFFCFVIFLVYGLLGASVTILYLPYLLLLSLLLGALTLKNERAPDLADFYE